MTAAITNVSNTYNVPATISGTGPSVVADVAKAVELNGGTFVSLGASPRSGSAVVTFLGTPASALAVANEGWNARIANTGFDADSESDEGATYVWTAMVSRRHSLVDVALEGVPLN